jgi:hypothetical protein
VHALKCREPPIHHEDDLSADRRAVDAELARLSPRDKIALLGPRQPAVERLSLPAADLTARPLAEDVSTAFPPPLGLGASWNPPLALQVGAATGDETRAAGASRSGWLRSRSRWRIPGSVATCTAMPRTPCCVPKSPPCTHWD